MIITQLKRVQPSLVVEDHILQKVGTELGLYESMLFEPSEKPLAVLNANLQLVYTK